MAAETQAGERYATQVGELWSGLSLTLARLEAIASAPERLEDDDVVDTLRLLQYRLHAASESVVGLSPPLASESAKAASNRNGRLLESVGSLCAVQLYQSYLNVGLLADAVEHDTYTKADAGQILSTIVTLSQTVDGQLQKLAETGLDTDDSTALDRVRKASALVRTQAMHLQTFWNSGEKNHIDDYQRVRRQCWQELRSILGLPEEKE